MKALAETCRSKGIPVIHVHYVVEPGAPGLKLNAPLFQGVKDSGGLVRGTWGAEPAEGLEPQDGDFIVQKMRMSAWQGTRLENLLTGFGRDTIIITGAWTNMYGKMKPGMARRNARKPVRMGSEPAIPAPA